MSGMKPTSFQPATSAIPAGLCVIEASAGTGKTYAISRLVPRFLLDGTASRLTEILLVTFTKDAARELSERVRAVLETLNAPPGADEATSDPVLHELRTKFAGDGHRRILHRALLDIDRIEVSTIHAFCQRVLQSEGALCGLPVVPEPVADADACIDLAVRDLWKTRLCGDAATAAIVAAAGFDPHDDVRHITQILAQDRFTAMPPPRPFKDVLNELAGSPKRLGNVREVRDFFSALPDDTWKKDPFATRDRYLGQFEFLESAASVTEPGFFEAVGVLAGCAKWLHGGRKEGKAAKEQLAPMPAPGQAGEIVRLLAAAPWHWRFSCAQEVREAVAATLHANRQITYDGLVRAVRDALRDPDRGPRLAARLGQRHKIALIDESQDTDAAQFEIFSRIFTGDASRMVLIGDPKQAIYEFRGANVNTYLAARKQAGGRVFSLSKTFRSPQPLVDAVNALFDRQDAFLKQGLAFEPASSGLQGDEFVDDGGARIDAWLVPDADAADFSNASKRLDRIVGVVASEIVRLLSGGFHVVRDRGDGSPRGERRVRPGDFAVLVSTNPEATAMLDALRACGVPAVQARTADVMASDEAGELLAVLRAMAAPRDSNLRRAALATRLLGRSVWDLDCLGEDPAAEAAMIERFARRGDLWRTRGVAAALEEADHEEGISLRLAGARNGERRLTNLRHLADLLQSAALETGNRPAHLLRWFEGEIAGAGDRPDDDQRQQQLESDADAVRIVTMHSAKGLEYNLVFCPFLWTSRAVKNNNALQKISCDDGSAGFCSLGLMDDPDASKERLERASIEDRLRLAYVAITRARVRAWIIAGAVAGKSVPPSALDWLLCGGDAGEFGTWHQSFPKEERGSRHAEALERIAASSMGALRVCNLPPVTDTRWVPADAGDPPHPEALPALPVPEPWGMTSFSGLTRETHPHGTTDPPESPPPDAPPANSFAGATGGMVMGSAIHDWIEGWDFQEPDRAAVDEHLGGYPLPAAGQESPPLTDMVADMLGVVRDAVLPGFGCTVAAACPDARLSEWHFQLPIREAMGPRHLAEVFARHGCAAYAAALERLPQADLSGFLHGFLDRLAHHDGTWGVIDWKTNRLADGYGHESLAACAASSHYLLQTHLYLVALRRWLGPQVPVAGAWLVFLRGVRTGTSDGILHYQPTAALLDDLDALFTRPVSPP
jgi:exodeoxyribonuclease V beta subunit